ncbi:MAG TPA: hypothetical protein VFU90_14595 [Candidatus Tumulicola sp.]|nr:hypothetical protein [Candidatus Tumulicola sp.]
MKALGEIYAFVTGGSIVAPVGVIAAALVARFGSGLPAGVHAAVFLGTVIVTFFASTLEDAR